ncbi:extracellular solute-binding protein [Brachybacterium sp. EF45031]|uniref:extracellular solute-binding protein n=1 Tax=Brachybacterium sillae TaxID=2810536 RepID=UPI00217E6756|nr:extracellular solute-binding protein [Brachybacterium sillae]MCS6711797.1 extracellular solute-binding protein [Brachybacterium sillae]
MTGSTPFPRPPAPQPGASRRLVLGGLAGLPLLAACGGGTNSADQAQQNAPEVEEAALPAYTENTTAPTPDIPGKDGSTPGYTSYPAERPTTVEKKPGTGQTFTAMVPTWSGVKDDLDNDYTRTLFEALGSTLQFQMTTGNDYRDKQAAVFASPKDVADWVGVFGWNPPARFDQAVEALFQDLTPFLAGDKINRWKNLANLPTDAWRFGIFHGKLYGLPVPGEAVTDAIFHRPDLFGAAGVEAPTTAEEFLEVCKALTNPDQNRWATNDMGVGAPNLIFGAPPDWRVKDGALQYRWETPEYRAALEFQRELYAKKYVHPEAAADAGDSKQRFESGQVALHYDGIGAWTEMRKRVRESNPQFDMAPLSGLSAGDAKPLRYRGAPANFFSFLKKSDDTARIEELLGIADYLAAPFGTAEWELVNFGKEGVHFTRDDKGVPVPTDALGEQHPGVLGTLVTGPVAKFDATDPEHVKAYCEWMQGEMAYVVDGPFYGHQVVRPVEYATLDQPMYDLEKDVARGRRTMEDFDKAVTTWKNSGGDRMREHYQAVLDEIGQ